MSKIQKQIRRIYAVSAFESVRLGGACWVALLAARGFSLWEIGIAEGVFHVASLLFEIPSGVISDVFGRKKSMILSQCMSLLSSLLMIVSKGLPGVCVSLVFSAFGYNFASGAREALAYDTLKSGDREGEYLRYSSMEYTIYRTGSACAILCAGLALMLGYRLANLLDMAMAGICLLLCFRLEEIRLEETQFEGALSQRLLRCFRESTPPTASTTWSESTQIKFHIIIDLNIQQVFQHSHREGASVAFPRISVYFCQLALAIYAISVRHMGIFLFQIIDHIIGQNDSRISGNRDHMQFLRCSIKADDHIDIGTETIFIGT